MGFITNLIRTLSALPRSFLIFSAIAIFSILILMGFFRWGQRNVPAPGTSLQRVTTSPSTNETQQASKRALKENEDIRKEIEAGQEENLKKIEAAIAQFSVAEGHYPHTLEELVNTEYLAELPPPPPGTKYYFVPKTGQFGVIEN
jgi:hypothetical protein